MSTTDETVTAPEDGEYTIEADVPVTDPSAPYGRDSDGTLLDKNGERAERGLKADGTRKVKPGPAPGTKAGAALGKPGKAKPPKPTRKGGKDYTPGVMGLFSIPIGAFAGLGAATKNDVFLADAATLNGYAPGIAGALNDLAQDNHQVASILDRALQVGPYSALIMATMPMVAQLARNHGVLPAGIAGALGASHEPADLADAIRGDAEGLVEQAAAA